jgi:hypothetical protein
MRFDEHAGFFQKKIGMLALSKTAAATKKERITEKQMWK